MAAKSSRIDEVSSSLTYIGEAAVGANENDPIWRISRITTLGPVTKIEYANGNTSWNSVWTNRASYSYS